MTKKDSYLEDGTHWRLYQPSNTKKGWAVLWLQGFTSTIEGHDMGCERMSESWGINFAILNYAGHGDNPTRLKDATRSQQLSEVIEVYDNLIAKGFRNIVVIGGSFGGYMAALLSGVRDPRAVVLRAPANYPDKDFYLPFSEIERIPGKFGDNMATSAFSTFDGPSYIIEHTGDDVIDKRILHNYFQAASAASYIRIDGLAHSPKLMPEKISKKYYAITELWLQSAVYDAINNPAYNH